MPLRKEHRIWVTRDCNRTATIKAQTRTTWVVQFVATDAQRRYQSATSFAAIGIAD